MEDAQRSTRSAVIGVLLTLPFAMTFSALVLGIEPLLGPLQALASTADRDPDQPDIVGSTIVIGSWLLAVAAVLITATPIVRNARAGRTLDPLQIVVAVAALFFVLAFVVGSLSISTSAGSASRTATRLHHDAGPEDRR
jgi:hypothetical protein